MRYDPWAHAEELELPVHHIPDLVQHGLWHRGMILIREGLPRRVARCVLAHEIVHAEHDDQPTRDCLVHTKQERRADRIAAQRLVTDDDLHDVMRWTGDPGLWCLELDITGWILNARMDPHGTRH